MEAKKPRFSVTVDADLYEKINDYQHGRKLSSQTQAIAEILKIGIESIMEEGGIEPAKKEPEIPAQLARIIDVYYSMNPQGQEELEKYAELLSLAPKYKKDYRSVSSKAVG